MRKLALCFILLFACNFKPRPTVTPNESNELVKVCWVEGVSVAQQSNRCDQPSPIIWSKSPLVVYAHPSLFLRTLQAVEVWNKELGFEMFQVPRFLPNPMDNADVFVLPGGPHRQLLGITFWRKNVTTSQMQSLVLLYDRAGPDTIVHELGHALGLNHDENDFRSIMYPNNSRPLPRIQTQDLALLRRLYAPHS